MIAICLLWNSAELMNMNGGLGTKRSISDDDDQSISYGACRLEHLQIPRSRQYMP
jgi:hypothetical protein